MSDPMPGDGVADEQPVAAADAPPGDRPGTGVPAADAARERLDALEGAPLDQHVEVFEDVHRRLQEGLADLDEQ